LQETAPKVFLFHAPYVNYTLKLIIPTASNEKHAFSSPDFFSFIFLLYFVCLRFGPDRRQDQFGMIPGYLVVPAPYVYPGLGKGWMLIGYGGNILETNVDAYLLAISGDAEGYIGSVEEIFVIPKYLYLSGIHLNIKKYGLNMYDSRGMESEKDDFNIFVGDKYILNKLETTLSLMERRIEFSLCSQNQTGRTIEIRDSKGENLQTIPNAIVFKGQRNGAVLHLDWTDDLIDPREGFRLKTTSNFVAAVDTGSPEYNIFSYGTGVRLIGGSGNVYRFEASAGNEGPEILLIFQYPWSGETG